jgi:hypothetical protein
MKILTKTLKTFLASAALCLMVSASITSQATAATYPIVIVFNEGTASSGDAASIQVTLTDSSGTVLVNASNNPSGAGAFTESAVSPGSYSAAYTVTSTNLPIKGEVKDTLTGNGGMTVYLIDRQALVADGYTASLPTTITNINTVETTDAANSAAAAASSATGTTNTATILANYMRRTDTAVLPTTAPTGYGGSGGGSDPWATAFPGAYAAGTFGYALAQTPASVWLRPIGSTGITTGQAMTALAATSARLGSPVNTWNATSHVLSTAYNLPGTAAFITVNTQYPTSQVTQPTGAQSQTVTVTTIPQP